MFSPALHRFRDRTASLGWLFLVAGGLTLGLASCTTASQPAVPAGSDRMSVAELCRSLGLAFMTSPDHQSVTITRGGRHGVLAAGRRDLLIDGVKVILGDAAEARAGELSISRIDYERRVLPLWRPALLPERPKDPRVIVLDPGHGGWAAGTENKALNVQEKAVTLDVALRLRPLLEAKGWTVILTRDRDVALAAELPADLDARSAVATQARADVFVSIHFNADATKTVSGSQIFTYAPRHQWATADWEAAQKRGARSPTTDPGAADIPANRRDAWNTYLAHALYTQLVPALGTTDLGERIAHFRVLAKLPCPAVLVEAAYLSNPQEGRRVSTAEFRQRIAEALAAGLSDYAARIQKLNGDAPSAK